MQTGVKTLQFLLGMAMLCVAGPAFTENTNIEIEYLLSAIGSSNCQFIRNGTNHPAQEGESHLRMKYRKGARYINSAETFIEKVASHSSWTKKPYRVRCPGKEDQIAAAWLASLLAEYRATRDFYSHQAYTEASAVKP